METRHSCHFRFSTEDELNEAAMRADALLAREVCQHVRKIVVPERDADVYVIYDQPCFDLDTRQPWCTKLGSGTLCVLGRRIFSAYSDLTVKVDVVLETTPIEALSIEHGGRRNGSCHKQLRSIVLHPIYRKGLPRVSAATARLQQHLNEQPSSAVATVTLKIRTQNPRVITKQVDLPVVVPSIQDSERMAQAREDSLMAGVDFVTMVLTETIKHLIADGWAFIKEQAKAMGGLDDDLIQLRIGEVVFDPRQSQDSAGAAAKDAAEAIKENLAGSEIYEMDGENRRLEMLYIKKKNFLSVVESARTTSDKAHTLADIEDIDKQIRRIQQHVWTLLEKTGKVKLVQAENSIPQR